VLLVSATASKLPTTRAGGREEDEGGAEEDPISPISGKFGRQKSVSRMILSHIFFPIQTEALEFPKQQFDRSTKVGILKEVIPAMRKALSNCMYVGSGVLFENAPQVGVKHEYVGAQGRGLCLLWELEQDAPTNFRAIIEEVDHLRESKVQGLLEEGEGWGCTVAVKTQAKLLPLVTVRLTMLQRCVSVSENRRRRMRVPVAT
jgi:hypothetical protein